jgi:hypothetical protein
VTTRTSVKIIYTNKHFWRHCWGWNSNSILGSDAKKCQQAFLVPLPGKVERLSKRNIDITLYQTDVIEETIYLYSNKLTLCLSTCVSYAG